MQAATYQLVIDVPRSVEIEVGRLGHIEFAAGRYVYTGSARRSLEARIARHLRTEKKLHWHIDYLLTAPGVTVVDIHRSARPECTLNGMSVGSIVVPGFGASDCRAACRSHLRYLEPAREASSASDCTPVQVTTRHRA